jgi:signal transduction histidine kinase
VAAFAVEEKRVVFRNQAIQKLIPAGGDDGSFQLEEVFLSDRETAASGKPSQHQLLLPGKTIGYTIYPEAGGLRWILASEITEKTYAQKIAENTMLINMLDYTFFNLTHELGNPVNSIKMTLEVLINNFSKYGESTRREYLDNLHGEVSRLEELLKSIKSINMYEQLDVRAVDVAALLKNLLQLMDPEIAGKGIAVGLECPQPPLRGMGDPRALHQVLLNIVGNAVQAMEGRPEPRLDIRIEPCGPRLLLVIRDNGCGIAEEKKRELFLPFFTTKRRGIGLGLTIARKLLTQMNGTIEIASRQHQGTDVRITLLQEASGHGR